MSILLCTYSRDISFFIEKKLEPGLILVNSDKEIEDAVARGMPTLVGHFEKRSSKEFKNYRKAASAFSEYITLCAVGEANVDIPMNTVHIYANGEKIVYNDSMSVGVI